MVEAEFQRNFVRRLKSIFPGCIVLKNDANYCQGIPDLIFLYKTKWAAFEIKRDKRAAHRPNQDYYVDLMNSMSYAKFVCPENEKEVLDELQKTF